MDPISVLVDDAWQGVSFLLQKFEALIGMEERGCMEITDDALSLLRTVRDDLKGANAALRDLWGMF